MPLGDSKLVMMDADSLSAQAELTQLRSKLTEVLAGAGGEEDDEPPLQAAKSKVNIAGKKIFRRALMEFSLSNSC